MEDLTPKQLKSLNRKLRRLFPARKKELRLIYRLLETDYLMKMCGFTKTPSKPSKKPHVKIPVYLRNLRRKP
jgi:hypothetical protein